MKNVFLVVFSICLGVLCFAETARAVVGDIEVITVGTSTTLSTGSSTVLAKSQYSNIRKVGDKYEDMANFMAIIQYNAGVAGVPMRFLFGTTGTPSATVGLTLADTKILKVRSLADMQALRFCAGTTTVASYGTATIMYNYSGMKDNYPEIISLSGN